MISQLKSASRSTGIFDWLRSYTQLIIVSDTFIEFADPLLKQLGSPTLLCHHLTTDKDGNITNYNLRQKDAKKKVVEALQNLNYKVIAIGDSYNDISMLRKADHGILYNPPQNVIDEHSDLMVVNSIMTLKTVYCRIICQN